MNFYETLHSCSTQPADVHEGILLLSKIPKFEHHSIASRGYHSVRSLTVLVFILNVLKKYPFLQTTHIVPLLYSEVKSVIQVNTTQTMGTSTYIQCMTSHQCRLNAWAHRAVARGPQEHRGPMLIYVCCDLLSINK